MRTQTIALRIVALCAVLLGGLFQSRVVNAQSFDVRLSTREAYVGQPVVLQLKLENASDYKLPELPEIDGCTVQQAGTPSQSSQITIINGRRSESRSITVQYLITPRREGNFEIPSLAVEVDGVKRRTQPLSFVATKSETGDLLFVEIEGSKDRVYVGEPIDLTLKIWLKPFVDRERILKLSEADMWQMISVQSTWGSFAKRIEELAQNRQRPAGRQVLRVDNEGNEREYYLYEIEAKTYPTRPGRIDVDDVQIVVSYPTELGRLRDPFESMMDGSSFGGFPRSRLSQLMDDDFFASPFSNRLSVTSSRPIAEKAEADATQVIPVPTDGRPTDYRGAVGNYKIVTQASPIDVSAGDPITLQIGIIGTGPMELVQAPPLSDLGSITKDFKVEDSSLAGFVQDDKKLFITTVRPRNEGVTEIPGVPFSFFDPDTETFRTAMSDPISITVTKAESLAMDAIVGSYRNRNESSPEGLGTSIGPDFTNADSASVLATQTSSSRSRWWLAFVGLPPLVWLIAVLVRYRRRVETSIGRGRAVFESLESRCLKEIERASEPHQLETALHRYLVARMKCKPDATKNEAIGAVRKQGLYQLAAEFESLLKTDTNLFLEVDKEKVLQEKRRVASSLVRSLDEKIRNIGSIENRTRRSKHSSEKVENKLSVQRCLVPAILAVGIWGSSEISLADEKVSEPLSIETTSSTETIVENSVDLSNEQQRDLLNEATELYTQAQQLSETDVAEANELFMRAATKYQLLVDSGIRNGELYQNLGNAYLQCNQLGMAIANYERALKIDPFDRQLQLNLDYAESKVEGDKSTEHADASSSLFLGQLRDVNNMAISWIGRDTILVLLIGASLLISGLLVLREFYRSVPAIRMAIAPALLMLLATSSLLLSEQAGTESAQGIIVDKQVVLRAGDGQQFSEVATISAADGKRVKIIGERSGWTQVTIGSDQSGWVPASVVERLDSTWEAL